MSLNERSEPVNNQLPFANKWVSCLATLVAFGKVIDFC